MARKSMETTVGMHEFTLSLRAQHTTVLASMTRILRMQAGSFFRWVSQPLLADACVVQWDDAQEVRGSLAGRNEPSIGDCRSIGACRDRSDAWDRPPSLAFVIAPLPVNDALLRAGNALLRLAQLFRDRQ